MVASKLTTLLLISDDESVHRSLDGAFPPQAYDVTAERSTLNQLNGTAVRLAAQHDIVVFDVSSDDPKAVEAAKDICDRRAPNAMVIALANADMPLASAREFSKVGVDEIVPRASAAVDIVPQIEAWRMRQEAHLPAIWANQGTEGKIIVVAQARGGVGASTIAANLADALQGKAGFVKKRAKAQVSLVDLDFQFGSLAALMDVDESDALWRMAMDGTIPDSSFVEQSMQKADNGVLIMPAPSRYGPLNALTSDQVAAIMDSLRKTNDYIVVELPRALVEWMDPVLNRADRLLLATDLSVPSIRAARKLIDFYLAEHPALDIEIIASKESKPLLAGSNHRAAVKLLERQFTHWIPEDARSAREALDRGRPLSEVAPRSPATKAIRRLAADIIQALPPRGASS